MHRTIGQTTGQFQTISVEIIKVIQLKRVKPRSQVHLRSNPAESMRPVIVEIWRRGDFNPNFSSAQKALLTFNVENIASHDRDSLRSQFQNLTAGFILYGHDSHFRPAGRANQHIQTDTGNDARGGIKLLGQLQKICNHQQLPGRPRSLDHWLRLNVANKNCSAKKTARNNKTQPKQGAGCFFSAHVQ